MENHRRPHATPHSIQPIRVWRWRITRQWELSTTSTIGQAISLTVGLAILIWLWTPPNDGAMTLLMQTFVTAIWLWTALFLLGPYRTTTFVRNR